MKKINSFIKSRAVIVTLSLTFVALIVAGVTYAWFTWTSTDNTNITMQVGEYTTVTYTGGNAINVSNLAPVYNYTDGESTTFTLSNNNTDIFKAFKYSVYLDITSISNELKSTQFKYVLLDGSSNIISQGNFSSALADSALTIAENQTLPDGNSSYTFIIYIDGNESNNSNMMNKSLTGSLRVTVVRETVPLYAARYIKSLYTNATKSTATVNYITYNLAPSEGLMNDRHASMSTDINGGDIRYYGADPYNYVWLGDTYSEDITFPKLAFTQGTSNIVRQAGDKKLWRIVGVFDGKLKLVTADPISATGLSWDTSANTVNNGYGINQWGPSGTYEGADLMKLLNPGYEDNEDLDSSGNTITVNNSLYWNKGTGTVYIGGNYDTESNISFVNTGLTSAERNMIETATWYTGASESASYVDVQYNTERNGTILWCRASGRSGDTCNDFIIRTDTWNGKVGLVYPSDYGYATDLSLCSSELMNYTNDCTNNNWFSTKNNNVWTLSRRAYSGQATIVYTMYWRGGIYDTINAVRASMVRPAVYLKADVIIDTDGKDGSKEHPYELYLN